MPHRKTGNYFDISDILHEQERMPCKVEIPIHGMGYLDPSSFNVDLVPGTKLEMPAWMAKALAGKRRRIISTEPPKQYRESYREILTADASVVDLHKIGPYFYKLGTLLLEFPFPEAKAIAEILLRTFQTRFRKIMDSAQNSLGETITVLTERLDEDEKRLFVAGQTALHDFLKWQSMQTHRLSESELVRRHRKRKRVGPERAQT